MGWPHDLFAWCIAIGFVLSLVGDVALLGDSNRAFIVGLAAFLLGHVAYVIAFISVAVWSPQSPLVAVVVWPSTSSCSCA